MKKLKRTVAWILTVIFACGCLPLFVFGQTADALPAATIEELKEILDFSKSGETAPAVRSVRQFALEEARVELLASENRYYENNDIEFRYSDRIPAENVLLERVPGGVRVQAREYSYKAVNGTSVRFIPADVTVDGKTEKFSNEPYQLSFLGLSDGKIYEARVCYTAEITLAAGQFSSLLNAGYEIGRSVRAEKEAYEAALSAYTQKTEEYAALYKAYLDERAVYEAYMAEYTRYLGLKAEYDDYVAKKAEYERQTAAYENYLVALDAYEDALKAYNDAYALYTEQNRAYLEYAALLAKCARKLTPMSSIFWNDGEGHVMYDTLLGPTVDQVVQNQGKLEDWTGVDPRDVSGAGDATRNLRAVLTPYKELKTDAERYAYYTEHYSEIRDNFIALYKHLSSLGKNSVVCAGLHKEGKLLRYMQFVSHLYVISTCLDDMTLMNPEAKIYNWLDDDERYSLMSDFLSEKIRIEDNNDADPTGTAYPSEKLAEPVAPTAPQAPDYVKQPVKTWTIELTEPDEPSVVKEPAALVSEQEYTGQKPVLKNYTADQQALENDVLSGALRARELQNDLHITLNATVSRSVSYDGTAVVRFYDYDRKTLLYEMPVLKGENAVYRGNEPQRTADKRYSYTFAGFVDENGKGAVLTNVREDCDFYASYTQKDVLYTVRFYTHGENQSLTLKYGEMPASTLLEESYYENGIEFRFAGYEPAIAPVTEDAEYRAVYLKVEPKRYTVTFIDTYTRSYALVSDGETPQAPETKGHFVDERYEYNFTGWIPEISAAHADAEYTAEYAATPLIPSLKDAGAPARLVLTQDAVTVVFPDEKTSYDIRYAVNAALEASKPLRINAGDMTIAFTCTQEMTAAAQFVFTPGRESFYCSLTDAQGTDLLQNTKALVDFSSPLRGEYRVAYCAEEETVIEHSIEEGTLCLTLSGSGIYTVDKLYAIVAVNCNIVLSADKAKQGELVVVRPAAGNMYVTSLVLTVEGEKENRVVLGDSFEMPEGKVLVEGICSSDKDSSTFIVTFYDAEGGVYQQNKYGYNDLLLLPETPPVKASDDPEYEYVFVEWSPIPLDRVVDTAEYNPVFKYVKKGESDEYVSPYDSDRFFTKVILARILPMFLGIVLAVGGAAFGISYFLRKKRKSKKQ